MCYKKVFFFCFFLFVLFPLPAQAALSQSKDGNFSIELPAGWVEWPANFQDLVGSYGKQGTLATFYLTARDLEEAKTVLDLKWEDLFKPQFDSIHIHSQGETVIGGEKARYCLYTLKPGEFKKTMEGKLPAKYMNYVLLHQGKLYSITFKDTLEGFSMNYPSFVKTIRSLRFKEAAHDI